MDTDKFIRVVLWVGVVYNLFGALPFAFPSSPLGQFAGLPIPVPPLYNILLAFFPLLFGGAYAWLALQTKIDRPLVAFAAIGKAGAFVVIFMLWLFGAVQGRVVLGDIGDLIFACLFAWWLLKTKQGAKLAR